MTHSKLYTKSKLKTWIALSFAEKPTNPQAPSQSQRLHPATHLLTSRDYQARVNQEYWQL